MNSFLNLANKRIANVIKELNSDAKIAMNKATDQEKGKITLALLYYKIVLQGCISFENNVSGYVKALKDCSMDESDIGLILDKYCGETAISISLGDIELDENPYIDIDVKEVKNPGDIELDENPEINIDVKDIKSSLDIELDENPIINMEVKVNIQNNLFFMIAAVIACTPLLKNAYHKGRKKFGRILAVRYIYMGIEVAGPVILVILAAMALVGNSYNPFLYFQF